MTGGRRNGSVPLKYETIAATLRDQIRAGKMPRQLPGEVTLAARFRVSRATIRQALEELANDGLIATRAGIGSFVTYDGAPLAADRGWATAFRRQGIETTVEVLRIASVEDSELADKLGQEPPEFVAVERVRRLSTGVAISYERSRLAATDSSRSLSETGLVEQSLTATLASLGLFAAQVEQWVEARQLREEEAQALGRDRSEWFLITRRLTRTAAGELVEFVESALDPEHFRLHLKFD
jgi:GntR family transcriptional regulator